MMEKLEMKTASVSQENIEKIRALFPNTVTEVKRDGRVELAVDFDVLKQELSDTVIEAGQERYQMTWPDKRKAVALASSAISATLRPCKEESVGFDTTENLYIEGDNLDVLKLLRETYLGKVKMIYIDPPYNTGNDFVYEDDFAQSAEEYTANSGQYDEQGNRLFQNTESNGRFHTDWLNMIYPRLKVARDLLTDDGVIFISIDDNEQANLKKICDEVFGESNFIAQIVWERAYSPVNLKKHFSESHDYIICYSKDKEKAICNGLPRSQEANERYSNPDNDTRGVWTSGDLSVGPRIESKVYEIVTPSGRVVLPPSGYCWRLDEQTFNKYKSENRIWFGEDGDNVPRIKRFLSEVKQGITPLTVWKYTEVGHSQDAAQKLKKLFDGKAVLDYPKSVELIKRCVQLYSNDNSIILDFFSGSATTAHAVMQLNAEDGGKRKFIMVQLPEKCDEKSEAYKAGYKNICEIGKERIRRAGKKIKEESPLTTQDLDTGFRVLKLDSSNMQDVFYNPSAMTQSLLDSTVDNVKPDRTPLDLLFQVMLELGKPLSAKIEEREVDGKKYYAVDGNDLIACFDDDLGNDVITAIAKQKPLYAVFKDKSFATDSVGINNEQLFKTYSPATVVKVI
ncbi:MAG: site-specific DNA-methyltransferase [Christensenellales bacterium]|nr:site-specific DNA-methyltransferase [Christensenellales bacterium]